LTDISGNKLTHENNDNGDSAFNFSINDLTALIELSSDLIFALDFSGRFKYINKSGAMILDYLPSELVDKLFVEIVKPDLRQFVSDIFQNTCEKGDPLKFEAELIGKHKEDFHFIFLIKPIKEAGKINRLVGIGTNKTNLLKLEEEVNILKQNLSEAEKNSGNEKPGEERESFIEEFKKMKAEFISNISHEFRTPLASIIGFAESISSDSSLTPELKDEFINIILEEGKRLAKLINNVLDQTKL
jgi:PAS domain S-box-containing protein